MPCWGLLLLAKTEMHTDGQCSSLYKLVSGKRVQLLLVKHLRSGFCRSSLLAADDLIRPVQIIFTSVRLLFRPILMKLTVMCRFYLYAVPNFESNPIDGSIDVHVRVAKLAIFRSIFFLNFGLAPKLNADYESAGACLAHLFFRFR